MLKFLVVIKVEGTGSSVQSCEGDISLRERRDVGEIRGAERLVPLPPDDVQSVGYSVCVLTRGRVKLPGDPATVWVRVLGPGIIAELFIDCETFWSWGGKLQSYIGDVIGLVYKNFLKWKKILLSQYYLLRLTVRLTSVMWTFSFIVTDCQEVWFWSVWMSVR